MAQSSLNDVRSKIQNGHLSIIDKIPAGEKDVGAAVATYADSVNGNRNSRQFARTLGWIENILFGLGHHYLNQIMLNKLVANSSSGNLSIADSAIRSLPRPVNDLLGRYVESNIALLTENRPIPRVTPLSDSVKDRKAAELSELTINFLWEELGLPEKHREIARLLLYTGVAFLEVGYDPLAPRYLTAPETREDPTTVLASGMQVPVPRQVPMIDPATGELKLREEIEWGEITANVVSGFEMHLPPGHWWNGEDMGWILREKYMPIDALQDKFDNPKVRSIVTKANGYHIEALEAIRSDTTHNYPLWWWERLSDIVEGPSTSLYMDKADQYDGSCLVRYFDRKPNPTWPRGRTVITVGDQVLYDSPKRVGARAFDPRWPTKWHPYIRYRWEPIIGSLYGRSLVGKLLPKLKRVNSIDVTLIMWRRTVPIASWTIPEGTAPVEDFFKGGASGAIPENDPRRTAGAEPKPVFPPSYPAAGLQERDMQIAEMESIAGTESILRGERPTGVNSAAMIEVLRKQALASRSATLQSWDEALQDVGSRL